MIPIGRGKVIWRRSVINTKLFLIVSWKLTGMLLMSYKDQLKVSVKSKNATLPVHLV